MSPWLAQLLAYATLGVVLGVRAALGDAQAALCPSWLQVVLTVQPITKMMYPTTATQSAYVLT